MWKRPRCYQSATAHHGKVPACKHGNGMFERLVRDMSTGLKHFIGLKRATACRSTFSIDQAARLVMQIVKNADMAASSQKCFRMCTTVTPQCTTASNESCGLLQCQTLCAPSALDRAAVSSPSHPGHRVRQCGSGNAQRQW